MGTDNDRRSERETKIRDFVIESQGFLTRAAELRIAGCPILAGKLDAADLVQKVNVHAFEHLSELRGSNITNSLVIAWLQPILHRVFLNEIRHYQTDGRDVYRERPLDTGAGTDSGQPGSWLAAQQSSPSGRASKDERVAVIREAMESLPEGLRVVIRLFFFETLTQADITAQLGVPKSTVANRLRLGMKKLRELLPEGYRP